MTTENSEHVQYDEENDVLYVLLSDREVAKTVSLDDLRLVDYDADNQPVGIEFISASDGLELANVPNSESVRRLLDAAGIEFPIHV